MWCGSLLVTSLLLRAEKNPSFISSISPVESFYTRDEALIIFAPLERMRRDGRIDSSSAKSISDIIWEFWFISNFNN